MSIWVPSTAPRHWGKPWRSKKFFDRSNTSSSVTGSTIYFGPRWVDIAQVTSHNQAYCTPSETKSVGCLPKTAFIAKIIERDGNLGLHIYCVARHGNLFGNAKAKLCAESMEINLLHAKVVLELFDASNAMPNIFSPQWRSPRLHPVLTSLLQSSSGNSSFKNIPKEANHAGEIYYQTSSHSHTRWCRIWLER